MIKSYRVQRTDIDQFGVGNSVAVFLSEHPDATLLATLPVMLTLFGTSPKRYEVTEVQLIVEEP